MKKDNKIVEDYHYNPVTKEVYYPNSNSKSNKKAVIITIFSFVMIGSLFFVRWINEIYNNGFVYVCDDRNLRDIFI